MIKGNFEQEFCDTKVATATSSFTFSGCSTCLVRNRPTKRKGMQMLEVDNGHSKPAFPLSIILHP